MTLTAATWKLDLADGIADHITSMMKLERKDVEIGIKRPLKTPFVKPIITLAEVSDDESSTGGMNVTDASDEDSIQQGFYHEVDYLVTVNTDDRTGKERALVILSSILGTIVFEQKRHLLLSAVNGIKLRLEGRGSGSVEDWYQAQFLLSITVIVEFDSVVL